MEPKSTPRKRRALPSAPTSTAGTPNRHPGARATPSRSPDLRPALITQDSFGTPVGRPSGRASVQSRTSSVSPDYRLSDSQAGSLAGSLASSRAASLSPDKLDRMMSPDRDADEKMENQNVVVAVRVRPPNSRELAAGGGSIVAMAGNQTVIQGPQKEHNFQYDHSFTSFDKKAKNFSDQRRIFQKLGLPLLNRAMEGYNCCLFAYGQTGSGKSYSMMGEQKERGIIPRFAEQMWAQIKAKPDTTFKVEVSYFEIYSERIFDLLVPPASGVEKDRLKVREHPIMGPYVENLKVYPAVNFEDILGYIALGSKYRATASTNMNATSSRSHAVFTMTITQVDIEEGEEHTKVSKVNLIDLAGSERSDRAGTSGQRLREGSAINKSLHTLGKIISALAAYSGKKKKSKNFVPYRDSVLTWILKESLGGNAKTAMLATLSPCYENYQETLSTLRYAQQARSIVNEARINEDENIALIRDLRAEINKLRDQYGDAKGHVAMAEVESMRDKLAASERLMADINRSWEEKLRHSERVREENHRVMEEQGVDRSMRKIDNRQPNLVNLNEDPQLSEMLIYIIKNGDTTIGKDAGNDVELKGVFVRGEHAQLHFSDEGGVSLTAIEDALLYVNGVSVPHSGSVILKHGDRIIIGNHHFFRLNIPKGEGKREEEQLPFDGEIKDYRFAREELERVQTERIEAQLQIEHDKQKEEILQQLEHAESSAQYKLDLQRQEYERKLSQLAAEQAYLAGQSNAKVEQAVVVAQTEERERAMAEIERQRRELESERAEMESRLREEKEMSRQQMEEEAAAKNKIIDELELEKSKIEEDLQGLKKSHERRRQSNAQMMFGKDTGKPHEQKKHDWIRISARINEANELSTKLKQNTLFTRADGVMESGEAMIQLHNTKLGIATTWTLAKFEDRLLQISEAYRQIEAGGDPLAADDLFYDPDDEWTKEDIGAINQAKWLRSQPRSRSLYDLGGTGGGQFKDLLGTIKAEAKAHREQGVIVQSTLDKLTGGSKSATPAKPALPAKPTLPAKPVNLFAVFDNVPSVPLLCRQYIKNSLGSLQDMHSKARSSADDIVEASSALRCAVDVLCSEYNGFVEKRASSKVPLRELGNVRNASLSAAISTELLCSTIRAVTHGPEGKFIGNICDSLAAAATSTATAMGKLLQGVENSIGSMVTASQEDIIRGINAVSMAAGELAIATSKEDSDEPEVDEEDDDELNDPGEFAAEEEEASYASTSRMVQISPRKGELKRSASVFKIDDEILEAFEKGTRMHVDRSLSNLTHDMEDCSASISNLIQRLNPVSNVSAGVVQAVSNVIKSTREAFVSAQTLQAALLESTDSNARAKNTFYRKSFSRAKGIITEIREVADAINGLVGGCKKSVEGAEGVESVMSQAKTLRAAIARLTSGADTKLGGSSTKAHRQLSAEMRNACNDVTRASKQLTAECEEYSGSDAARLKRQTSTPGAGSPRASRIGSARGSSIRKSMKAINSGGTGGAMSEVKRRALMAEADAEVYRLEAELRDAQASVKDLRKSAYSNNSPLSLPHMSKNDSTSTI